MKSLVRLERSFLIGHILSMAFGLAGLLLVLPNPDFIANLSELGQNAFRWSMADGDRSYRTKPTRLWKAFQTSTGEQIGTKP